MRLIRLWSRIVSYREQGLIGARRELAQGQRSNVMVLIKALSPRDTKDEKISREVSIFLRACVPLLLHADIELAQ